MSLEQRGRPTAQVTDRGPLDRRRPRIFVAVSALAVTVLGSLGAGFAQPEARPLDAGGLVLLLVTPLALVVLLPRRPAAATVVSVAATGGFLLAGYPWGPAGAGPVVLLAAVVLSGPARRGRVMAWSGAVLLLATVVTVGMLTPPTWSSPVRDGGHGPPGWNSDEVPGPGAPADPDPATGPDPDPAPGADTPGTSAPSAVGLSPAGLTAGAAWTVVALLAAGAIRDRVTRRVAARAAARETAAERERTAVTAERLRIARELHDVLAHSLSGINVQAGVGLHLLERDPGQARTALTNIRDTSRDALAEVRTVLGIVRAPLDVTWDMSGIERLAAQTRAEGLDVTLDVDAPGVPERIAGAAHRVVQEALTNIRRHATGATRVTVTVRREGASCLVVVSDDGHGEPPPDGGGYGLRGMRERVEALGGTLRAGPDDVGWLVRAAFPLPEDTPAPDRAPGADVGRPDPTDRSPEEPS